MGLHTDANKEKGDGRKLRRVKEGSEKGIIIPQTIDEKENCDANGYHPFPMQKKPNMLAPCRYLA